ncbi:DUF1934 domain-containing protein [Lactobacillus helveticus]|uniref:DUF1934 domain-containing protein n=1 Tax=Lactobacillus helveticus TaxID=1587 RepID=UPI0031DFA6FB
MAAITINLTSKITQDDETETFTKVAPGQLEENNGVIRVSYKEDDTIPVKMLLKEDELIIRRGVDSSNYSLMKFVPGEKANCRYVVEGRQMDMTSVTNLLEYEEQASSHQLRLEYDIFNGLYLISNYAVTLIFT